MELTESLVRFVEELFDVVGEMERADSVVGFEEIDEFINWVFGEFVD